LEQARAPDYLFIIKCRRLSPNPKEISPILPDYYFHYPSRKIRDGIGQAARLQKIVGRNRGKNRYEDDGRLFIAQ
jgi:hypothetical protein